MYEKEIVPTRCVKGALWHYIGKCEFVSFVLRYELVLFCFLLQVAESACQKIFITTIKINARVI